MLPNFEYPSIVLFFVLEFCVYALALWKLRARPSGSKGGEPELCASAVLLITLVVSGVLYGVSPPTWSNVDLVGLLIDCMLVTGFTAIALNANRIWPLVAAGAQLVGIFSHFSRAVQLDIAPMAYSILSVLPTGIVLVCVMVGFIGHFYRMKRFGYDQDWMDWTHHRGLGPTRG